MITRSTTGGLWTESLKSATQSEPDSIEESMMQVIQSMISINITEVHTIRSSTIILHVQVPNKADEAVAD